MSILVILLVIVLAGVGLYVVDRVIPMEPSIKLVLRVVVILVLVLWLLSVFGLVPMHKLAF